MLNYSKTSGSINVIDNDNGYYTVVLDKYVGTIEPDETVFRIKFILHHVSTVINAVELTNRDKLDSITVIGKGSCTFRKLQASIVEVYTNIACLQLSGIVLKLESCSITSAISSESIGFFPIPDSVVEAIMNGTWDGQVSPDNPFISSIPLETVQAILDDTWSHFDDYDPDAESVGSCSYIPLQFIDTLLEGDDESIQRILADLNEETGIILPLDLDHIDDYISNGNVFIEASDHIWVNDCTIICAGVETAIKSPYILMQNNTLMLRGNEIFNTDHDKVFKFASISQESQTAFDCTAYVLDENGDPKTFAQTVWVNESGEKEILSRRITFNYEPMTKPISTYDQFKRDIGYTHVNLHTKVEPPEYTRIRKSFEPLKSTKLDLVRAILSHTYSQLDEDSGKDLRAYPLDPQDITVDKIIEDVTKICEKYEYPLTEDSIENVAQALYQAIQDNEYNVFSGFADVYNNYMFDEVELRWYDEGIYSLNLYRTTGITFHEKHSQVDERP